jgi:hypothetical protein
MIFVIFSISIEKSVFPHPTSAFAAASAAASSDRRLEGDGGCGRGGGRGPVNLRRSSGERTAAHPMGGKIGQRVRLGGGQAERLSRCRGGEGDSYLTVVAGTRQLI